MIKAILRKIVIFLITIEARLVLKKYNPNIIAITGNAGKTGAKDAIAAVLEPEFSVWKNEKSYNSDIGIPLTILHCKNGWLNPFSWLKNIYEGLALILFSHDYPKWLVLEVGADKPDDIGKFAKWLHPDIVVVTRIGETPVHVELFPSRDDLIEEKAKLVRALRPGGILVLNADDPDVLAMRDLPKLAKVLTYGFSPVASFRVSNQNIIYIEKSHQSMPDGITFKIDYLGNIIPVRLPGVVGRQNIYSALAAFAVGTALNINFIGMIDSAAKYERPAGRLRLIDGISNSIILDDTYNSSPAALELAIESVHDIKVSGRKIAVLGDMLELGHYTNDAHYKIGKQVPVHFDMLVTVGQRARAFAKGAFDAGMKKNSIKSFSDSVEAGDYIKGIIGIGDLVLVKGSQGVRMERVVEKLMATPEDKLKFLVRQEKEWIEKV
ncbi:MAG: UDP-N-acetylmuramoyl-tripeptide--D-alanyl-D-alanine ligase [bacterium]|nr:UDP-N-acetylmuramoyl-tripeptide--D-alanyl-D-alanine ligase [bacterium]